MGMKKIITLAQWIIQKTNSEAYRCGRLSGWKHPKVDKTMLESVGGRKNLLEQAKALEQDSVIGGSEKFKVDWRNLGSDIEKIHYDISIIPELCKKEGIVDPREKQQEDLELLSFWKQQVYNYPWILEYYSYLENKLQNGIEIIELQDEKFFRCLNAVVLQKEFIFERIFSVKVFNDSKLFRKKYRDPIFSVLKKYSPYFIEELGVDELFARHEIHSYSQTLEWKGNLQYEIQGDILVDSAKNIYGTVMNTQTMEHAVPYQLPSCKRIMTIENKANYENMSYEEETLYIYCHGYFSPKEIRFLKGILNIADPQCEFYHWGDMDFGGINIFLFIKDKLFPKLKPYRMGEEDFQKAIALGAGIPLEEETRKKLERKEAGVLEELKKAILETGLTVEQENILVLGLEKEKEKIGQKPVKEDELF